VNPAVTAAARTNFPLFLHLVFAELHEGDEPLELTWYLKAICHHLTEACENPGARLVITVPPRRLKSVAASVALPAFLLGLDPTRRVMVATYSQDLARLHAQHCRQIMQSEWYKCVFPNSRISDGNDRLHEFQTTAGGGRKAVSVGGTITGFGADYIIVDDCLKADDARSQARRDELVAWFNGTLQTRQNTAGKGVIISISQRLHEDDLPAHLIEKGYTHLCLPAVAEKYERVAIGPGRYHERQVGDLLGRKGLTQEVLESERRNLGPQVFSAQYQQNPTAPEGNLVRLQWFGTYDEALPRDSYQRVVQSWDTGMTDALTSDYSVCTTWGFRDGKWWLLHVLRQQMAYPDLKRAVIRQWRTWKADKVVIEDACSGKSLWQEFRTEGPLRPVMWQVSEDKETRLIGVTGQLEEGHCLLPREAPWLDAFRSELRAFPFGKHDDQVDSMTQFLQYQLVRRDSLLAPRDPSGRRLHINRTSRFQRAA
jgi:predicted phage terminase large subunit-like protein